MLFSLVHRTRFEILGSIRTLFSYKSRHGPKRRARAPLDRVLVLALSPESAACDRRRERTAVDHSHGRGHPLPGRGIKSKSDALHRKPLGQAGVVQRRRRGPRAPRDDVRRRERVRRDRINK